MAECLNCGYDKYKPGEPHPYGGRASSRMTCFGPKVWQVQGQKAIEKERTDDARRSQSPDVQRDRGVLRDSDNAARESNAARDGGSRRTDGAAQITEEVAPFTAADARKAAKVAGKIARASTVFATTESGERSKVDAGEVRKAKPFKSARGNARPTQRTVARKQRIVVKTQSAWGRKTAYVEALEKAVAAKRNAKA